MPKKRDSSFELDGKAMGELIRRERKTKGFNSPKLFVERLKAVTGFDISTNAALRVESDGNELRLSYLFAVCVLLYGKDGWQDGLLNIVKAGLKPSHIFALESCEDMQFLDTLTKLVEMAKAAYPDEFISKPIKREYTDIEGRKVVETTLNIKRIKQ